MPLLQCCHSTLWAAIHNVKLPLNHTQLLYCSHTTRSAMLLSWAARDATAHLSTLSAYQCAQSTPHTHFGRQRDSRVRPTSRGGLGPASTHLTVLVGWAVLALTSAGPAHHTGQQGVAAADRTTCCCVPNTASTAPLQKGRTDRSAVTLCTPIRP